MDLKKSRTVNPPPACVRVYVGSTVLGMRRER